jgi:probable HAF family extracellular repeat protein
VIWQSGKPILLPSIGGITGNIAFSVNDNGVAVGQSDTFGDGSHHAVLWRNGVVHDLGTLNDLPVSLANFINNRGQVVGFSQDFAFTTIASLWQNGQQWNLNYLIPKNSDYFVVEALQINDAGQIATDGYRPSTGEIRGALLTPVDGQKALPQSDYGVRPMPVLPPNVRALIKRMDDHRFAGWAIKRPQK